MSGVLGIAFCVSFFLSAVSMGTRKVDTAEGAARASFLVRICTLRNLPTPALWIGSGVALGTSYLMAYAHFNLNARGYHLPFGTLAGIAGLLTLFVGILLPGITLRRRMSARAHDRTPTARPNTRSNPQGGVSTTNRIIDHPVRSRSDPGFGSSRRPG